MVESHCLQRACSGCFFYGFSHAQLTGKNQNKLCSKDIDRIVETYRYSRKSELKTGMAKEKYSYIATSEKIKETLGVTAESLLSTILPKPGK